MSILFGGQRANRSVTVIVCLFYCYMHLIFVPTKLVFDADRTGFFKLFVTLYSSKNEKL